MVAGASTCLVTAYTRESLVFLDYLFSDRFDIIFMEVENVGYSNVRLVDLQVNHASVISDPEGVLTIDAKSSAPLGIPYSWSSGQRYTLTLVTSRGNVFSMSEVAPQRQLPLEMENIYWDSSTNTTTITVRNVGTEERKIIHLYLFDSNESWTDGQPAHMRGTYRWVTLFTDIDDGKAVNVNQTAQITLYWPNRLYYYNSPLYVWTSGENYHFQIVPETGPLTEFASLAP